MKICEHSDVPMKHQYEHSNETPKMAPVIMLPFHRAYYFNTGLQEYVFIIALNSSGAVVRH